MVFRGAHLSVENETTSIETGNAHRPVEGPPRFVSAWCSEGDTLLPGNEPAFGFTRGNERDLIGELRRAVEAAEAFNTAKRGRE
jgi:hypothetical protein